MENRKWYLIKNNVRIDDGIEVKDTTRVMPFDHMAIATSEKDSRKVILVTEKLMEDYTKQQIVTGHKNILGDLVVNDITHFNQIKLDFNAGHDITITNLEGQTQIYNQAVSKPGDIIFVKIQDAGVIEEMTVINGQMEELTFNYEQMNKFNLLNFEIDQAEQDITELQNRDTVTSADVYLRSQTLSKQEIDAEQAVQDAFILQAKQDASFAKTQTTQLSQTVATVDAKIQSFDNEITEIENDLFDVQTDLDQVKLTAINAEQAANDWAATKGKVVTVDDISSSVINAVNKPIIENGQNVEVTLDATEKAKLVDGKDVVLVLLRDNVSPSRENDVKTPFNGNVQRFDSLTLEGVNIPVTVSSINDKFIISGLTQAQRTTLITNYRAVRAEQLANVQGGSNIDATARQAAADADTKATAAKNAAALNTASITTLQTDLAGKQATLTATQLGVINGEVFTAALKTIYDGYGTTINAKQDKIMSAAIPGVTATSVEGAIAELAGRAVPDLSKYNYIDSTNIGKFTAISEPIAAKSYVDKYAKLAGVLNEYSIIDYATGISAINSWAKDYPEFGINWNQLQPTEVIMLCNGTGLNWAPTYKQSITYTNSAGTEVIGQGPIQAANANGIGYYFGITLSPTLAATKSWVINYNVNPLGGNNSGMLQIGSRQAGDTGTNFHNLPADGKLYYAWLVDTNTYYPASEADWHLLDLSKNDIKFPAKSNPNFDISGIIQLKNAPAGDYAIRKATDGTITLRTMEALTATADDGTVFNLKVVEA